MICDKLSTFFDSVPAAASATSEVVEASAYAGRNEPVFITVTLAGDGAAVVKFTVEESADGQNFTAAASGFSLEKSAGAPALASFVLPSTVKKKFVRLSYTLTGSAAGLILWAGVTRDNPAFYEADQMLGGAA